MPSEADAKTGFIVQGFLRGECLWDRSWRDQEKLGNPPNWDGFDPMWKRREEESVRSVLGCGGKVQ